MTDISDVQSVERFGLDDDDLVELQALGHGRRHEKDPAQALLQVLAVEHLVLQAGRAQGGSDLAGPGIGDDDPDRARMGRRDLLRGKHGGGHGVGHRDDVQPTRVAPHRLRRGQTWGDRGQQPRGVVDDGTRHPEAADQLLQVGARGGQLLAQVPQRLRPGPGRPGRGALGEVTQDGQGAGRGTAADGAELHRRQVLRLVKDHVAQARGPLEEVRQLVEQDQVGGAPAGGAGGAGCLVPHHDPLVRIQALTRRQDPGEHRRRLHLGPERLDVGLDRRRPGHAVLHPVVGGVAGALHRHQHGVLGAGATGVLALDEGLRIVHP